MDIESILITGSSGTVGTALIKELKKENKFDLYGADIRENPWTSIEYETIIDLTDKDALEKLPTDIDLVIHLAAHARVFELVKEPTLAKENFDMTFNVLEYMRENGVKNCIFASSREIYGNRDKLIHSENDTFVDECESPYTASKIGGESLVKSYGNCYDINTATLRFSNVFGKYDLSDRVVPLFLSQANRGEDLVVFGDDKVLDFTYIDDCIQGIKKTINNFNKVKGTSLNIASGEGSSLVELAETVVDTLDSDVEIRVEDNRRGEVSRFVADISKAEKIIQYEPEYSFSESISATVDWYLERPDLLATVDK